MDDGALWHRIQFAFTISYHYLFPQLTMGLALVIVILKVLALLSAALSGFYLAFMFMLWLLIVRGIAIELRSRQDNLLWREFWDTAFSLSSALLAVVLGASLGNMVRGVPLDSTGLFAMPLFTDFQPGVQPGIFDWYTTLVGIFTLCVLAGHGALYLVWKTTGPAQVRSAVWARKIWLAVLPLWVLVTLATGWIRPEMYTNLLARPWSLGLVLFMLGGLCGVFRFLSRGRELAAFLSSSSFLVGLLATTMAAVIRPGCDPRWTRPITSRPQTPPCRVTPCKWV
jgi:cytochrome d ubiquinol oxidase subunit II